ncbi:hypothetical protein [Neobacillus sp. DY30]|uniref:hypothetical protein n=1 Tax=Neobacillus sp. DY30 TaxID=3047871 RepID=UPI0024C024CB|nr:hypothetical protein [Neobacillus sp. DY30]WHY01165.1 hypothetical protein QNH29_02580 [Neobacillus sp. DY30]
MPHKLWIAVNGILIIFSFIYIWFFRPPDSSLVILARFLAQIAMYLFLININMYFIFLVIRKTSVRQVKIRLAKFSRVMMKWHIPIAAIATTIIIGHAVINLIEIAPIIGFNNLKLISGYLAMSFLFLTLAAGYLRHKKSSGFRRKFHLITAMAFLLVFFLHMFIPI